jgi:hypothetical protein
MRRAFLTAALAAILLIPTCGAWAQPALYYVFVQSSRVALLPFSNPAEVPLAMPEIMHGVRAELLRKSVELADSGQVADVLRRHRIRNTSELTVAQVQTLSKELNVSYLLVGSLEAYGASDKATEIALSARLLAVPTVTIEWSSSASAHSNDRVLPFDLGHTNNAKRLVRRAVTDLFHSFRYGRAQTTRHVESVKVTEGGQTQAMPCRRVAVLAFANETSVHGASQAVTNQLVTALYQQGFEVVDPGRVREVMLGVNDLTQGEMSQETLHHWRDELGADFVLTGTVSEYESQRMGNGIDDPSLSVESRRVDTQTGQVTWAKALARHGSDSGSLFGLGSVHSLAALSRRMARACVAAIPRISHRQSSPSHEASVNDK